MECAKIHIISDGTPHGTFITADGKQLAVTHCSIEIGTDGLVMAKLTLYVDKIDVICHEAKVVPEV